MSYLDFTILPNKTEKDLTYKSRMAPKKMKVENVEEENQKDVTEDVQTIPKPNISRIKNKILRNEMYKKLRVEKRKVMKPEFSRNSSCIVCFSWI